MTGTSRKNALYRVLHIDDRGSAHRIEELLSAIDGWDVEMKTCGDPEEALDRLQHEDFDVVLLDQYLGCDQGLAILDFIVTSSTNRFQPVIMVHGRGDEELALSAIKSGVVDYIPTGFLSSETLEQTIRNAVVKAEMRAEVERQRAELEQLARTDPLTGALNRRAFDEALEREALRAVRFGSPLSLLMIDLDDFKAVNDEFGHLAGDDVLCRVAGTLRSSSRAIDACARWGGDEFAALLCGTGAEGAQVYARRLRENIGKLQCGLDDRCALQVTCSIGIAEFGEPTRTPELLVEAADRALHRAKQAGRDRIEVGSEAETRPGRRP